MKKAKQSKRSKRVRLAIVGGGGMAQTHAVHFAALRACELVAVVEVDAARRAAFAQKHGIPKAFASVDEMLADPDVDAVSIVTPDALHAPLSIACLNAGKHVLCEKPLALDFAEARTMVAAARKSGKVNMVNFSYRNWPCIQAVATRVSRGDIGEIRHVEASYLQSWLSSKVWGDWRTSPQWLWRLSSRHGSKGVLGDVGVHIVDFATYPVGPVKTVFAQLKAFPKAPRNRVGPYVLDANDSAVMNVTFGNGALGTIHTTRWATGHANRLYLKICGTHGAVEIDSERSTTSFRICSGADVDRAQWKEVNAPPTPSIYERYIRSVVANKPDQPDFARGAEVQRVLDACFVSNAEARPVKVGQR